MKGNDPKLCDPSFCQWDWIAVQRARELELGCPSPDDLTLHLADESSVHAVPAEQRAWLEQDALAAPST